MHQVFIRNFFLFFIFYIFGQMRLLALLLNYGGFVVVGPTDMREVDGWDAHTGYRPVTARQSRDSPLGELA